MSRLIVKNIPNLITEAQLKTIFEKKGEVSDVKVIFKGNKNRRFCFIGYKNESDAIKAKEHFDKTFVMMSKISVDFAKTVDDPALPRAWSRHTPGSSAFQKVHKSEEPPVTKKVKQNKEDQQEQEEPKNEVKSKKFQEFLELMKTNKKSNQEISWNDNVNNQVDEIFEKIEKEKPKVVQQPKTSTPANVNERRLYVTNIPYTSTEQELKTVFEKYGTVSSLKIPKQRGGSLSGFCFVEYQLPEEAIRAFSELDNKIVLGRIFHVRPAFKDDKEEQLKQEQQMNQEKMIGEEKSSYKKFKKQQMLERLNDTTSWNTLFLNPNTIIEGISKKYSLDKKEILSEENDDMAVKMAQMETQVIKETKDWLKSIGLNIDFLKVEKNQCERSNITIFVKNIQFRVNETDLNELFSRYGQVNKVFLAPNRSIGIITMQDDKQANNAFTNLQNYKFKGCILYLEWAPTTLMGETNKTNEVNQQVEEQENELTRILYVKNLNFSTTEKNLLKFMSSKVNDIKKVTIINKEGVSQGYGFIEFDKPESAQKVLRLNNLILDDHLLQLSQSKPKPKQDLNKRKQKQEIEPTNKLLIKNLPFEANAQELRRLIKQYGELKKLRLPKKLDGSIRGFAFAEFLNNEEAQNAAESLQSTHFYGRRLVIEYSKEE
ncbi:unnamed protein product [Paramecium octaurelia]|uniref:RRM domain-containing protein n=1 Tax=Paramecium octaurelia TaxID=43137 RepID=A0A8S1WM65_PAROT|nr:unnamed protein product [Paramecium octaurelia]